MITQPFTARNVAKFVVKAIVADKTAELAADAIVDHTSLEEDSIPVFLGSRVVGWYVSDKLSPVTDKIVDKTADFVAEKREARKIKKLNKKDK